MRNDRLKKRVHTDAFLKYFTLRTPAAELSDSYIETVLGIWTKSEDPKKDIEETFLDLTKAGHLLEFLEKLNRIYLVQLSAVALPIIRVVYENIHRFSTMGRENLWRSEYDKAEALVLLLIDEVVAADQIQTVLEEVISKTADFSFGGYVVVSCKKEKNASLDRIYEAANVEELRAKLASRLKAHFVDEKRDIFDELPAEQDWGPTIYYWATNFETFEPGSKSIVNKYLYSIVKNSPNKFAKLLARQRTKNHHDHLFFDLPRTEKVLDLDMLNRLAQKFRESKDLSAEERDLLELYLQTYEQQKADS